MHETYWRISESPFRIGSLKYFYESPVHEEALARMHFLAEQGRTLGILIGGEGCGKSMTLSAFADQLRLAARHPVLIHGMALGSREFLWNLAAGLGANPRNSDDHFALWRSIDDQIAAKFCEGRPAIVLVDDAGQAAPEMLIQVQRLLKIHAGRVTLLLAVGENRLPALGSELLQMCELRIYLAAWDEPTVRQYLQSVLPAAGREEPIFDELAISRLHQLSGGVPRWVAQLAELALIAGTSQELTRIDAGTIEAVYEELTATYHEPEIRSPVEIG